MAKMRDRYLPGAAGASAGSMPTTDELIASMFDKPDARMPPAESTDREEVRLPGGGDDVRKRRMAGQIGKHETKLNEGLVTEPQEKNEKKLAAIKTLLTPDHFAEYQKLRAARMAAQEAQTEEHRPATDDAPEEKRRRTTT